MSTIKDVAEHAGLSVATISKYLNGGIVKAKNRELIVKAIEDLDYQVNPFARSLKTRKSYSIGALVPSVSSNFFGTMLMAMDAVVREKDYDLVISCFNADADLEHSKLETLINSGVDGIIYMPENMDAESLREHTNRRPIPIVLVDRLIPSLAVDAVVINNSAVVYSAAEILISKGHRRIGFIAGQPHVFTASERYTGLKRVLKDYGIPIDKELIKFGDYTVSDGYRLFNELVDMPDPPTAIICGNYDLTLGALTAASERGISLPTDIDFFGFDCTEICKLMNPPVDNIEQPEKELGETAARYLLERLEGLDEPSRLVRMKAHLNCY